MAGLCLVLSGLAVVLTMLWELIASTPAVEES